MLVTKTLVKSRHRGGKELLFAVDPAVTQLTLTASRFYVCSTGHISCPPSNDRDCLPLVSAGVEVLTKRSAAADNDSACGDQHCRVLQCLSGDPSSAASVWALFTATAWSPSVVSAC